ncbi:unnamed protein product, partial [Urochloa humidicola]
EKAVSGNGISNPKGTTLSAAASLSPTPSLSIGNSFYRRHLSPPVLAAGVLGSLLAVDCLRSILAADCPPLTLRRPSILRRRQYPPLPPRRRLYSTRVSLPTAHTPFLAADHCQLLLVHTSSTHPSARWSRESARRSAHRRRRPLLAAA